MIDPEDVGAGCLLLICVGIGAALVLAIQSCNADTTPPAAPTNARAVVPDASVPLLEYTIRSEGMKSIRVWGFELGGRPCVVSEAGGVWCAEAYWPMPPEGVR